jgi:hypothetical protein
MIRTKSIGVRLDFTSEPIRRLVLTLALVDRWSAGDAYDGDLIITSGNDSRHSVGSRHFTNEAIDVRTHNFHSRTMKRAFRGWWENELGPQFRVLLEHEGTPNEHFHAQVKKGHTYRPEGF